MKFTLAYTAGCPFSFFAFLLLPSIELRFFFFFELRLLFPLALFPFVLFPFAFFDFVFLFLLP